MLEHIREANSPKTASDTLATLFSRTNDAHLQFLENELGSIVQGPTSIGQYFMEVKTLCHDISQLDPDAQITKARMHHIIARELRPKYNGFVTTIRGWPTQPSLVELESLLATQETLDKQMSGVTLRNEEEALLVKKGKTFTRPKKKEPVETS